MQPEELIDLIKTIQKYNAEMQHIEVKAAKTGYPKRLYDTISSFQIRRAEG